VAATGGTRTELFAFARLTDDGRLPQALRTAHARRRYALAQPEAPACDVGLEPGKPCHCDEAMVRDHACRQSSPGPTRVGVCGFTIDDKTKKLTGVAASSTF
jgi:hypothetical protein